MFGGLTYIKIICENPNSNFWEFCENFLKQGIPGRCQAVSGQLWWYMVNKTVIIIINIITTNHCISSCNKSILWRRYVKSYSKSWQGLIWQGKHHNGRSPHVISVQVIFISTCLIKNLWFCWKVWSEFYISLQSTTISIIRNTFDIVSIRGHILRKVLASSKKLNLLVDVLKYGLSKTNTWWWWW